MHSIRSRFSDGVHIHWIFMYQGTKHTLMFNLKCLFLFKLYPKDGPFSTVDHRSFHKRLSITKNTDVRKCM